MEAPTPHASRVRPLWGLVMLRHGEAEQGHGEQAASPTPTTHSIRSAVLAFGGGNSASTCAQSSGSSRLGPAAPKFS